MPSITPSAASASLVSLKDGKPITTSCVVAESFDRNHKHVLNSINAITASPAYQERCAPNFRLTSHLIDMPNGGTREERMYEMDRQGFEILAMGFTGEKALRWKFKYSDAFAAMEAGLKQATPTPSNIARRALALIENGKIVHLQDISGCSIVPTTHLGTLRANLRVVSDQLRWLEGEANEEVMQPVAQWDTATAWRNEGQVETKLTDALAAQLIESLKRDFLKDKVLVDEDLTGNHQGDYADLASANSGVGRENPYSTRRVSAISRRFFCVCAFYGGRRGATFGLAGVLVDQFLTPASACRPYREKYVGRLQSTRSLSHV